MGGLPIARLFLFSAIVVFAAGGAGFLTLVRTGSETTTVLTMLATTGVGIGLLLRWWLPAVRAAGIPTTRPRAVQIGLGFLMIAIVAAVVTLEMLVYGRTGNRLVEAIVALVALAPVGIVLLPLAYRLMPPATNVETPLWRLNYYLQLGLPLLFALNLFLTLSARHHYAELRFQEDVNVAAYFAILALAPFNVFSLRRRYLQSRSAARATPTATLGAL